MNRAILFYILIFSSFLTQAQPVPDSVVSREMELKDFSVAIDLGINGYMNDTSLLELDWLNSKGINVSVYKSLTRKYHRTSFKVGLSIGLEGYKFKKEAVPILQKNRFELTEFSDSSTNLLKSKLALNYVELPVELQWKNRWEFPIKLSVGMKFGYLFDTHHKVKKESNGDKWVEKTRIYYGAERFRFSSFVRASIDHFGVFGAYNFIPIFDGTNGPQRNTFLVGFNYIIDLPD